MTRSAAVSGFTLVETLMALALLTVGILGIGAALSVQAGGAGRGATIGLATIGRANFISTATMLASERIEQMRNATYSSTSDTLTTASFPNEAYGAIASYTNYRRTVTIQDNTPAANMKTVTVDVFFRPPTETGLITEESVRLMTIIAKRN